MESISNDNLGPLIAYLVPRATALWGVSQFSAGLRNWFATAPVDSPTISGFLYLTVASLAMGMIITAIRWAVVDQLHALTGLRPPKLDFSRLDGKVEAFALLIEIHYRHYQFYSNMFVATIVAYAGYRLTHEGITHPAVIDIGVVVLEIIFFMTSRDTLQKYFVRTAELLSAKGR
jgi:hypothetical protein